MAGPALTPRGQADAVFICFKKIGTLTYNSIAINTYSVIPEPCKGEGAAQLHAIGKEGGRGGPGHKKGEAKIDLTEFLNDPLLIEGKQISTLAL